jgi:ribosome maturation factor RimP
MGVVDAVTEVVAPLVDRLGAVLVDVEHHGAVLRVVVDDDGGIGTERLTEVTRAVSEALDDADPLPAHYTLEVSSPGLERPLRRPDQFVRAIGEEVSVKTRPSHQGARRLRGRLVAADGAQIELSVDGRPVTLALEDIERARTVFEWGSAPKPGKGSKPGPLKAAERGRTKGAAEPAASGGTERVEPTTQQR